MYRKRKNTDRAQTNYFLFQGHVCTEMREVSNILYQISSQSVGITHQHSRFLFERIIYWFDTWWRKRTTWNVYFWKTTVYGGKYQNARSYPPHQCLYYPAKIEGRKLLKCLRKQKSKLLHKGTSTPFGNYKIMLENVLRQRLCKCTLPCRNVIGVFCTICSNVHLAPKKGGGRF